MIGVKALQARIDAVERRAGDRGKPPTVTLWLPRSARSGLPQEDHRLGSAMVRFYDIPADPKAPRPWEVASADR